MPDAVEWKQQDKRYHEEPGVVASYDRRISRKFLLEHKHFTLHKWIAELQVQGAQLVLDSGCGTGTASLALLQNRMKTISVDASFAMLAQLKKKSQAALLEPQGVAGDVEHLPFQAECFDGIMCFGVLHHLPNITRGIEEQLRVLKKGGLLFISEPFRHKPWISYPYYALLFIGKCFVNIVKRNVLTTPERTLTFSHLQEVKALFHRYPVEYEIQYFVYWPNIFGYLPENIALPCVNFVNKINRYAERGDAVFIKVKKTGDQILPA